MNRLVVVLSCKDSELIKKKWKHLRAFADQLVFAYIADKSFQIDPSIFKNPGLLRFVFSNKKLAEEIYQKTSDLAFVKILEKNKLNKKHLKNFFKKLGFKNVYEIAKFNERQTRTLKYGINLVGVGEHV